MPLRWLVLLAWQGALAKELPALPLRTSGRFVVDGLGRRVRLHCVNWYGAHLTQLAANGLNRRSAGEIAHTIAEAGFNCVRLPFSLDGVIGNISHVPDPEAALAANPVLKDLSPLEIFDATVRELTAQGIMVILNNHVSRSMWCCSMNDGEGLWYTSTYPESAWLQALSLMAARYRDNPLVVGFDLRNEIRPSGLAWPGWHTGNNLTDWAAASVRGAHSVLEVNENMLIIISGVYFSLFLCQVPTYPVHTEVPFLAGRVIYTAHEYDWFNFHLLARRIIQIYCFVVAVSYFSCWLLILLVRRARQRQDHATQRLLRCLANASGCMRCRCRRSLADDEVGDQRGGPRCGLEFCAAALLTALSALCLKVVPAFVSSCGTAEGVMVSILCGVFAPPLAVVSLVLWIRAAFLAFVAYLEPPDLQMLRSSPPVLPVSDHGEHLPPSPRQPSLLNHSAMRHVKQCRSLHCAFILVACFAFSTLAVIWVEFGSYEAFERELNFKWGFLLSDTSDQAAPVWLGEFGTNVQSVWWQHMLTYLQKYDLDFAYWSVNGEQRTGYPETFGLFMENFRDVRHPWKLQQLQSIMNLTHTSTDNSEVAAWQRF